MATSTTLSTKEVLKALNTLTWQDTKHLAILLEVSVPDLNGIDNDYSGEERKVQAIEFWLNNDINASWEKLVAALREIKKAVLAEQIARKHVPKPTLLDTGGALSVTTEVISSPATSQLPKVSNQPCLSPALPTLNSIKVLEVKELIAELEKKYLSIVSNFRSAMSQKEEEDPAFVEMFQDALLCLPVSLKATHQRFFTEREDEILAAKTSKKLIAILSRYWSYNNCGILRHIIATFGDDKLKELMRTYEAELEAFEMGAMLDIFIMASTDSDEIPPEYVDIALKIQKDVSTCTVHEVRRFSESVAKRAAIRNHSIYIGRISISSVCVLLGFHPAVLPLVLAALTCDFLQERLIEDVEVNGQHLLTIQEGNLDDQVLHASEVGGVVYLTSLLNSGGDVNVYNSDSESCLDKASSSGHLHTVRLLLERGAKVESRDKEGWTPLTKAACEGHSGVVDELLIHGADVNSKNNEGRTALHYASYSGHLHVVQALLLYRPNIDVQDNHGWTALHYASWYGHLPVVQLLLSKDPNLDLLENHGDTPLLCATIWGYSEVVRELVNKGADVNVRGQDGWTALWQASYRGYVDIVKILLELKEERESIDQQRFNGLTPLVAAAMMGHIDVVKELLKHGASPNIQDPRGDSALIKATLEYRSDIVQELVDGGADLNLQNEEGLTALLIAVKSSRIDIIDILLKGGSNIDIQERSTGWSALFFAVSEKDVATTERLLAFGANVFLKDKDDLTALDVAKCHSQEVYDVLNKYVQQNVTPTELAAQEQRESLTKPQGNSAQTSRSLVKRTGQRILSLFNRLNQRLRSTKEKEIVKGPHVEDAPILKQGQPKIQLRSQIYPLK